MPTFVVISTWKCQVTFVFVQKRKKVILQDSALFSFYVSHFKWTRQDWMSLYHDFSTTVEIISAKSIRTLEEERASEAIRWLYSSLKVFFLTRARDSWFLLTLALIFFLSQADTWSCVSVEGVDHSFVDCQVNRAIMKVKWLAKSYLWIHYFPRGWRESKCHSFSLFHPLVPWVTRAGWLIHSRN